MKYNLGCGFDYKRNWINVDRVATVGADLVHDLTVVPWPIADDAADEILLSHVLEDLLLPGPAGLAFFQELFRIAKPGCKVTVKVTDPAATAAPIRGGVSAAFFETLDLARCEAAIATGAPTTPHAVHLRLDFALEAVHRRLAEPWAGRLQSGELTQEQAGEAVQTFNNVVKEVEVVGVAVKPFRPGRWLRSMKGLVVQRIGGLGDVLMALSACRALKSVADVPIYLETAAAYVDFARLCPHVNGVFDVGQRLGAQLAASASGVTLLDWAAVRFGISNRHEVDAFLTTLGLFPADAAKGLDIVLEPSAALDAVAARLAGLPPGAKRVILHPGVTDPNRTWPPAFWQAVARHALDRGCAVITIGSNAGPEGKGATGLDDANVLDLTDSLDLAGSLHLMRQCDMLISGDAGPIQLAGASDIHIVGLYSVVGGDVRLPFRHGSRFYKATAVAPSCDRHPCYGWLYDGPALTDFCKAENVASDNIPALFARWCINPDRYACTREPGTLTRVMAEIDKLVRTAPLDPALLSPGNGRVADILAPA